MAKKNFFIIFLLLLIPFTIIIYFINNSENLQENYLIDKNETIKHRIEEYDIMIFEQIDLFGKFPSNEFQLSQYQIFPYAIVWKDTLSKIAYKYNLTKDEIKVLVYINKIKNKDLIIAGQTLLIAKKKH